MAKTEVAFRAWWDELWGSPIAAERLALVRITTCIALLCDILLQQLPFYSELFAAGGLEPHGYGDAALLGGWRWTAYFFTPSGASLGVAFGVWLLLVVGLAIGFRTRLLAVGVWLLTLAMLQRHYYLKNFGDSVLRFTTFMLMFVPSDDALSWDAWRRDGHLRPTARAAWGVRLFQLQLCAMYAATGVSKLIGPLSSTWYQGTSLHYALNDLLLARVSYALVPVPLWVTLPLTYLVLTWEVLFVPLVLWRRTRRLALGFGVVFHLVSFLVLELGWFGFYVLGWYCAWIPDEWFTRAFYPKLWARFPSLRSAAPTTLR
jgi:hypothetical protein